MEKNKTILIAKDLADVFYHIKNTSELQIISGCTATNIGDLKERSVSIRSIPELNVIERRERYYDFGSAVTISRIISTGKGRLPSFLIDALETIGTEQIKNIATIGGNICSRNFRHTLWSPLLALNAKLEIKGPGETKTIPFSQFTSVPEKHLLTKIRIPLNDWDIQVFKRTGPKNSISNLSAGFTFLVETQHGIITNIRITFAGNIVFFNPEYENKIIGTRLPLSERIIDSLVEEAKNLYMEKRNKIQEEPIIRAQFLNLLRNSFEQLM